MTKLYHLSKIYYLNHKRSILFLCSFWSVFIIINALVYLPIIPKSIDILRVFINYPIFALIVFLPQTIIIRQLIFKKKGGEAILATLINWCIFLMVRYSINYFLFPILNISVPNQSSTFLWSEFLMVGIYAFMINTTFAYGYCYGKLAIDLEISERKLIEANAKLQHEKDLNQIAFLQAQINPHFLYNTLNFIYSEAIMVSDSVADSIMTLSNIMRYTLTETGKDTLVSLYSEINHIKNYLRIQKMRFSNELYLDLTIEGEKNINHLEILPLVLISFVENVFKHGDIHDPQHPAKIGIIVEENSFSLSIYNRKNNGPKEHTSGVGMNNISVRMDILYGEKYQVNIIKDSADEFELEFNISDMEEAFRNLKKYKILNA